MGELSDFTRQPVLKEEAAEKGGAPSNDGKVVAAGRCEAVSNGVADFDNLRFDSAVCQIPPLS